MRNPFVNLLLAYTIIGVLAFISGFTIYAFHTAIVPEWTLFDLVNNIVSLSCYLALLITFIYLVLGVCAILKSSEDKAKHARAKEQVRSSIICLVFIICLSLTVRFVVAQICISFI